MMDKALGFVCFALGVVHIARIAGWLQNYGLSPTMSGAEMTSTIALLLILVGAHLVQSGGRG